MRRITTLVMLAALVGVIAVPVSAEDEAKQKADVLAFADLTDVGNALLVREGNGVRTNIRASAPPGVYTLWWVVWNTPEGCSTPFACNEPDLFDPEGDTGLAIGYGGGAVVGANGQLRLNSTLRQGSVLTGFPYAEFGAVGLSLPETTLVDVDHAEIHLVLRSHQSVIPDMIRDQRSSFNGGCVYEPPLDVESPSYGVPGPNTCADTFFAVFASVDSP